MLRSSLDDGRSSTTGSTEAAGSLRRRDLRSTFILYEVQPGADVNTRKSDLHKALDNSDGLGSFTRVRESGRCEDFLSLP